MNTPVSSPQDFSINGLVGLVQNDYYWIRHPDGTRFIAKLENNLWWGVGIQWSIAVTREQVIGSHTLWYVKRSVERLQSQTEHGITGESLLLSRKPPAPRR